MLRKPKRHGAQRLRDVDGTEYDPDTGEKINSEAIWLLAVKCYTAIDYETKHC